MKNKRSGRTFLVSVLIGSTACLMTLGSLPGQLASRRETKAADFQVGVENALKQNAGAKFLDPSLPLEERVDDLFGRLTLEEKASLLHGVSGFEFGSIERLSIPSIGMTDGPQGVRGPTATKFPSAISMASTWDPTLIHDVGAALADETRASGSRVLLGPAVDIVRTPLGGRTFEYFGEDPYLSGVIAVPYVEGLQENGVGACLKHLVGNSQEKWRRKIDARIPEKALREIYLPAFEKVVHDTHVWSVMGSYNKVNGTWACENDAILNQILKKEWNFDGAVISDWGAWHDSIGSINGGCTLEMTGKVDPEAGQKTLEALRDGKIDQARFDDAVRRNLRLLIRSGIVDPNRGSTKINTVEHQQLSLQVAEESLILLKNEGHLLPLKANTIKSIAVIGPNANWKLSRTNARDSGGSGAVFPPYEKTGYEGLKEKIGSSVNIRLAEGFSYEAQDMDAALKEGLPAAIQAATESDIAIVFVGTNHSVDREATSNIKQEYADKPNLQLIGPQAELINAVARANPRTIVVLINGAPVTMGDWIKNVPTVLEAWYPGMEGGAAIANILFGEVNPSGKLPLTLGRKLEDWKVHSLGTNAYPGTAEDGHVDYTDGIWVGYRWFDKAEIDPEFPFGFGLSYTTFEFTDGSAKRGEYGWDVSFDVTNTGKVPGAEVAQLYVQPVAPKADRPIRELKRFQKLFLQPGEKRTVSFRLLDEDLHYWDEATSSWIVDPGQYVFAVGNSSRHLPLQIKVEKP